MNMCDNVWCSSLGWIILDIYIICDGPKLSTWKYLLASAIILEQSSRSNELASICLFYKKTYKSVTFHLWTSFNTLPPENYEHMDQM